MKKIFFSLILGLTLLTITSCGNGSSGGTTTTTDTTTTTKTVPISITIDNLQKPSSNVNVISIKNKPASSVKITISASDISTIQKIIQVNGRAIITETFDITPGSRTFAADIFDSEGKIILTGSTIKNIPTSQGNSTFVIVTINVTPTTTNATDTTTTTTTDTTPPTDGTLSATSGDSQVSLSWRGFSDTGGIVSYKLVYSSSSSPSSCSAGTQIWTGTGTSYTHTGLTNSTTYYYRVCVTDNAGNTSSGATASETTTATVIPDTTAPTVSSVNPTNGSTGVSITPTITATFSENMDSSTIIAANFTLAGGGSVVGIVSYDSGSKTATFTPSSNLSYSITYTATVTTNAKDSTGNSLPAQEQWTFTTGAAPDTTAPDTTITGTPAVITTLTTSTFTFTSTEAGSTFQCKIDSGTWGNCISGDSFAGLSGGSHTFYVRATDASGNTDQSPASYTWTIDTTAPTVSSVSPANGATGVLITSSITAIFNEAMDSSTVTTSTFTINGGVTGTVTYSGTTATFTPSSSLSYSTTYTATITTVVKDLAGNAMVNSYSWSFTTTAAPDTTPPTVQSISPSNSATGVSISTTVTATFSEAMEPTTITTSTFIIGGVTGTVTYSGTTTTLTPSSNLSYNTAYTSTVTTGVKDLASNAMVSSYSWSFTTEHGYGFSSKWGSYGSGNGQFSSLFDITVDSSGNVYVADAGNARVQKFDSAGNFITKWGSAGSGDGQFGTPWGIAVDTAGNVYVADVYNNRIQKFDSNGNFITKWGSLGSGDGQFNEPYGVVVDSSGNVYIADRNNNRIQKFTYQ